MKTFDEYYNDVKQNAINLWTKEGHTVFKNMENDPVIDLLLKALSYQAFHIQKNIDQYEEKILRDFRDRIIPVQLIKPVPAFSIIETKIVKAMHEIKNKIINESCEFEFKKSKFVPLLETKIINAELKIINQQGNTVHVELQSVNPINDLSGLSFYVDTPEHVDIEAIRYRDYELPLIKYSQYDELPFTKWFNNAHLFLNQNYYLFGTYDYWQEIFLTNTNQLFYIGIYDTNRISLNEQTSIELEIVLNTYTDISDKIKINCIPVVNVVKKNDSLEEEKSSIIDLSRNGEFLNLLYDKENIEDLDEYMDSFLIRQYGVERYNSKQLLEQMQEILYKYEYDYYAFQNTNNLRFTDKLRNMQEVGDKLSLIVNKFKEQRNNSKQLYKQMQEIMSEVPENGNSSEKDEEQYNSLMKLIQGTLDDVSVFADKFEEEAVKDHFYAILKRKKSNKLKNNNVHLEYLITSGEFANGIKKSEKATKAPIYLDKGRTVLLLDTKGGKNSIKDESQKENIAKYYFQTRDRLITPADIRTFIKTFYFENSQLDEYIENITIKRESECIDIAINLKEKNDIQLKDKDILATTLQSKIMLRSSGILPFQVKIF